MKKFVLWIVGLALGLAGITGLGAMLLPVWIMGSRHVGTAEHLESFGASVVELGLVEHEGTTVVVPVEVVAAKDAPIAGSYTKVQGKLIVAEQYVYLDAAYGIGKFGWHTRLRRHYGKDLVTVEFPNEQVHSLRKRFHVAECCTPPPWQWQARGFTPESSDAQSPAEAQALAAARAAAESSVAQALAAAHAASTAGSLDTDSPLQKAVLLARPGDSLLKFQSQLSPTTTADPTIKYELRRSDLGVRVFLTAEANVKFVRFDWPYAEVIGGIKVGDSLEEVRKVLGESGKVRQGERERHQPNSVYFERVAGFPAQVDLDDAQRVKTIVLR